jgi:transposase
MNERYIVKLTDEERGRLRTLVAGGSKLVRDVTRAQILLAADADGSDEEIARTVCVGTSTVYRTKRRFVEEGLEQAIHDRPRPGAGRKLTGHEEALLVATACSRPPEGCAHWTMELLAGALVRLTHHATISRETVRRRLAEKEIKPWQEKMWCVPTVNAAYVARMEDVLDLHAGPPDPRRPIIYFDESPTQLIGETRTPTPCKPGQPARVDYEYRRNGTANLFVFFDAHRAWRHVKVTDQRTAQDFAACMRDLVDVHYPEAERIRVILDNLSTHSEAALYQSFSPEEARRILRCIEFHYVPKHASWLNMVEIEIGVLKEQCLSRRIGDKATLLREIAAWEQQRNAAGASIRWLFTVDKARSKMARSYPKLPAPEVDVLAA